MRPEITHLKILGVPLSLIAFERENGKQYWLVYSVIGFKARVEKTDLGNWWIVAYDKEFFEGFSGQAALEKAVMAFKLQNNRCKT